MCVADVRLFRGVDSLHDDSQQLCHLLQASLQRAVFPLGDFSRAVVLSVAKTFPTLPEFKVFYVVLLLLVLWS
jgi:tRNA U34 2-thiouridine synthase MnmA/TrmU